MQEKEKGVEQEEEDERKGERKCGRSKKRGKG